MQPDYQFSSNSKNKNSKLPSTLSPQQPIWISAKNQTLHDREATYFFLSLRKKYADSFNDKITNKNSIWSEIATEMNSSNFFVGEGIQGREKCRQKFANLQASYTRFIDKRRQTGEGKIPKPQFFDDLNEILGDKHKIEPVLIIDSAKMNNSLDSHTPEPSTEISSPLPSPGTSKATEDTRVKTQKENKYSSVRKSARPDKNKLLQKFVEVSQENVETNKKNFTDMMSYLREEGKRRHEQIMALLTAMNSKKKRKREDSDSD